MVLLAFDTSRPYTTRDLYASGLYMAPWDRRNLPSSLWKSWKCSGQKTFKKKRCRHVVLPSFQRVGEIHPDVIRPHHKPVSKEFSFSSLKCFDFAACTENIMCQISVQNLPQDDPPEIQSPLPCNCWWNLTQPFGRTKRKSVQEPTGTVRRKRLAFGVPKDAATKTT
jgi:hypothetical protein